VRIIVATGAAGGTDLVARLVAQWLTGKLGQSFIVEDHPGGNNNIGSELAAHSAADGYTLFMANTVNTINAAIYKDLRYDFVADFTPVINVMISPLLLMVHPSVPAKSVPEFIGYAKANPNKLILASGGNGSTGHLAAELFMMMAGIKMVHVPYRGEALAMSDLISNQAQVLMATTGTSIPFVKAGSVRALAVTTPTRTTLLPDVPPLAEFLPGYAVSGWSGLCAPRNTPANVVDLLNREINTAIADRTIKQRITDMGGTAPGGSADDFAKFLASDKQRWVEVAAFTRLKMD
jgi:tripartite-type tricarboxylate transporter receptor subunit TctC